MHRIISRYIIMAITTLCLEIKEHLHQPHTTHDYTSKAETYNSERLLRSVINCSVIKSFPSMINLVCFC